MGAVALEFKVYEGGSAGCDLSVATLRRSMKTAQNARAVLEALAHSRGDCRESHPEECETADEEEDAVVEGVVAEDEEEDVADEEDEDLALGTLLESVVTAEGT